MIIDTDVLIWYLRGNERARIIVEEAVPFSITAATCMELMQGMWNKEEIKSFLRQLRIWKVPVIQIDEDISSRALYLVQEYVLSHSMMLADALIAATVIQTGETLLTANDKHYKFIHGLDVIKFLPE